MEQAEFIIPRQSYISMQNLLTDLETFNSELEFHTHGYTDPNLAYEMEKMLLCVGNCKKILKNYLSEVSANSNTQEILPREIIKTFENMVIAWKEVPKLSETRFIKLKAVDSYLASIQSILINIEKSKESSNLAQAI